MKRGEINLAIGLLVILIVMAATLIIIWWWSASTNKVLEEETLRATCQLTISLQAKTNKLPAVWDSPFKTHCQPLEATIEEKKMTVSGVTKRSYKELEEPLLNEFISERMRQCWELGLEGRQPIFNDRTLFEKSTVCLVCDTIEIGKLERTYSTESLDEYMQQTRMPDGSMTYDAFLFRPTEVTVPGTDGRDEQTVFAGDKKCIADLGIPLNPEIVPQQSYSIILFRDFSNLLRGPTTSCMGTYIMRSDTVQRVCDYVAN